MALSTFQQAFKEAREKGETEFEFGGKKYNTKYKEEVKTSAKPVSPMPAAPAKDTSNYSNEGRGSAAFSKSSEMPDTYRDLSGKVKVKEKVMPPSEYEFGPQNIKRNLKNAPSDIASGLKTAGSAVGDYFGKTFTMEGREQTEKERKERLGMKRGGSVKKMASGGNVSSASKRADGIAQKGQDSRKDVLIVPATSAKQKKFMDAAAHNSAFAKKAGVPVKVAKEFSKASKGQTFKQGGEMKESKAMVKKEVGFMKAKGAPKAMMKHEMSEMIGKKKMATGGMPMVMKDGQKVPAFAADGKGKMAHGGMTKKMMGGGYAKGGSASSRADGIAQKGKTKGKLLAKGGKAC